MLDLKRSGLCSENVLDQPHILRGILKLFSDRTLTVGKVAVFPPLCRYRCPRRFSSLATEPKNSKFQYAKFCAAGTFEFSQCVYAALEYQHRFIFIICKFKLKYGDYQIKLVKSALQGIFALYC